MRPVWYFDFISPFAYLQYEWLQREQPGFEFEPRPVLLAALLKHWGSIGPAELPTKRLFTYRFVLWQARRWHIPMQFPPAHPFNPLAALRLAIAAGSTPEAIGAIFRHIWRDGRPGDSAEALVEVAKALGIDDVRQSLNAPEVKSALAANGAAALADGVFGVPTFVAGGRLFWGVDATPMLLDWQSDAERFDDAAMQALETLPIGVERPR